MEERENALGLLIPAMNTTLLQAAAAALLYEHSVQGELAAAAAREQLPHA